MAKQSTVTEDRLNADRLEQHVRDNRFYREAPRAWWDPGCQWSVFTLAVIGAIFSIVFIAASFYPLAAISHKYWFGG